MKNFGRGRWIITLSHQCQASKGICLDFSKAIKIASKVVKNSLNIFQSTKHSTSVKEFQSNMVSFYWSKWLDQGFKLRCRSLCQPAPGCIGAISVVHAVHAWLIWSGYSSKVTKNCKKSKNIIEHKESVQNKIRKQHLILQRCLVCLKANDAHDLMKLTETAIIAH